MNGDLFLSCEAGEVDHAQRGGGGVAAADVGVGEVPSVTARIRAAPTPPLRRGGRGRVAGALFAALALGGCITVLPKATPVQLYRFGRSNSQDVTVTYWEHAAWRRVILSSVQLPRSAAGDGILTTTGDEAAYVGGARWLEPASMLFQEDAKEAFAARARAGPNGVTLIDHGQLSAASAVLRLDVSRFETSYPQDGRAPRVVVILHAILDRPDGSAVGARDFAADQPATADRVGAIVSAYDRAVRQVLDAVADWTATVTLPPTKTQGSAP